MCRNIVCVSLVQMHELILEFSDSYKSYTSSLFSKSEANVPPEVLVNQWKSYLIFACSTLTATNDQKISFRTNQHMAGKSLCKCLFNIKNNKCKISFQDGITFIEIITTNGERLCYSWIEPYEYQYIQELLENIPAVIEDWPTDLKKKTSR